MILTDIRDYLKRHGRAPVMDLAYHFKVEPEVIRSMVSKWIGKGCVARIEAPLQKCQGCEKCDDKKNEIYLWTADH